MEIHRKHEEAQTDFQEICYEQVLILQVSVVTHSMKVLCNIPVTSLLIHF